ncbi:site-2 protease family protein [Dysosmobacter sp.]|uniref:site-2 protease family protein n=1 Tax=Dysosmobacter sp. TaxID=2591382 RepID=UPI002A880C05|nr:site-2 protease family protein [Dysosmobacter sp.]MDY3986039.1 peptidase M50 [Dysosmobacter sp.]
MCLRLDRLEISGGFLLLTAWFGLVNGWRMLGIVLGASLLHETGHWLVLRLLGVRSGRLRITALGAELDSDRQRLSYAEELAAVLAGPAVNLLAGLLLAPLRGGWTTAAGAHLVLGAFNLLPVRPLDGGRALELAVSWAAGPSAGDRTARWVGVAVSLAMAGGLTWLAWRSGSLWLLPAAAGSAKIAISELAPAKKVK